jgi:hypothetical protein
MNGLTIYVLINAEILWIGTKLFVLPGLKRAASRAAFRWRCDEVFEAG